MMAIGGQTGDGRSSTTAEIGESHCNDDFTTRAAQSKQDPKETDRKMQCIEAFKEAVLTTAAMVLNFSSAVGVVVVNKALFRWGRGLRFATVLTAAHFCATAVGIRFCHLLRMYKVKPLRQLQVLPITIAFCAFVIFNNLSLQSNGVSFYQLMKILTTPAVVILQLLFFKVVLPIRLGACLLPICVGVALATASGERVSMEGAFWATAGLLAAAAYQLLVKSTQTTLKVSSMQLLHYQAPQAAVLVLFLSPLFDDTRSMVAWAREAYATLDEVGEEGERIAAETAAVATTVAFSCFLAFLVNLSLFLVIAKTSPVSYQVLGHFKLVVLLAIGVTVFGEDAKPSQLLGMAVALAGIVGYTMLKQGMGSGWEGPAGDRNAASSDHARSDSLMDETRTKARKSSSGSAVTNKVQ